MKIVSIVGARPQFIKLAPISSKIKEYGQEIIVHTGQHYDENMSDIFFDELEIKKPDYNLNIGSITHGAQTGRMLEGIEEILIKESPDFTIVFGDTNTTLAGALASSKLNIPVVHIEAGLRSNDIKMPEEQNRKLTDHISKYLFCTTPDAINCLETEGIKDNAYYTGDIMYDAYLHFSDVVKSKDYDKYKELGSNYIISTIHRPSNTDNKERLVSIFEAFKEIGETIILPLHPRTKKYIEKYDIEISENVNIIDPVGYLDMLYLINNSSKVITDSGGVAREAYFAKKPCFVLRDSYEFPEVLETGWVNLVGANKKDILDKFNNFKYPEEYDYFFGKGDATNKILEILTNNYGEEK